RGLPFQACLVSVEGDLLTVMRTADKKRFTVRMDKLHARDRAAVEALCQSPALRTPRPAQPLPPRDIPETEAIQAKRFVTDIAFYPNSNMARTTRWTARPTLVLHLQDAALETSVRQLFEDYFAATGLPDLPDPALLLVVFQGDAKFVNQARQNITPDAKPLDASGCHHWSDGWRALNRAEISFIKDRQTGTVERAEMARLMGKAFGIHGDSDVFRDSLFNSRSSAEGLTPRDRHFLRFFHRHVPPGSTRETLFRLV